jgi:hypothetical protein
MEKLTKEQMKLIVGGDATLENGDNSCNLGCTSDSQCTTTCTKCEEAPNWPGKFCMRP